MPSVDNVSRRPGARERVGEGLLHGGLPYLTTGEGPPLVALPGLKGEHANPTGLARIAELWPLRPLARHFTIYLVNRRSGLRPGTTMGDRRRTSDLSRIVPRFV